MNENNVIDWFNHQYPYPNLHELNLDWIIKHFNEFISEISSLEQWRTTHEAEYEELLQLYETVKKDYNNIASGNFPKSFYDAMELWWQENAIDLVGNLVRFVFFGLTEDGYFTAYIPDNWRDIQFDTIIDPDSSNYGRLTISY